MEIVLTGASGFLGRGLVRAAALQEEVRLIPLAAPEDGGIDLAAADASARLREKVLLRNPSEAVLIHAAAVIEWNAPSGLLGNAAMAVHLAEWARETGLGFSVLVSSVSASAPHRFFGRNASDEASSLYGLGKWVAESVWGMILPPDASAAVRLAGILGFQPHPSMFWNRLLSSAAGRAPGSIPRVTRLRSRRNYITQREAAGCLLHIARHRMGGSWTCAGKDAVDTAQFIEELRSLPGAVVQVDIQDDAGADEAVYPPSPEIESLLKPFPEALRAVWESRGEWNAGAA